MMIQKQSTYVEIYTVCREEKIQWEKDSEMRIEGEIPKGWKVKYLKDGRRNT